MITTQIEDANCLDLVRFRVSDSVYVCHKGTLLKFPRSKLAELIKSENDKRKSGLDQIIIDRNGKTFGMILRLMRDRTDKSYIELNQFDFKGLMQELDYFHLDDLKRFLERESKVGVPMGFSESITSYKFSKPTIFISPGLWQEFNVDPKLIRELWSSRRFEIYTDKDCYDSCGLYDPAFPILKFKFFLPSSSNVGDSVSLSLLHWRVPDSFRCNLISKSYNPSLRPEKGDFLRFLIAIEMYLISKSYHDLIAIEECTQGPKFRRYPPP